MKKLKAEWISEYPESMFGSIKNLESLLADSIQKEIDNEILNMLNAEEIKRKKIIEERRIKIEGMLNEE